MKQSPDPMRQSRRAELLGLVVLLTLGAAAWSAATRDANLRALRPLVHSYHTTETAQGVYPMLERYDPGEEDYHDNSRPTSATLRWAARVGPEMLGTRFEADWDETPPLPSEPPDGSLLVPRLHLLVDRGRHSRFTEAVQSLYFDCVEKGQVEEAIRLLMVLMAAFRQAAVHEVRLMGGFLPCTSDFATSAAYLGRSLTVLLGRHEAPRPLLRALLARTLAAESLMPWARHEPKLWPALVRERLAGNEARVDPKLVETYVRGLQTTPDEAVLPLRGRGPAWRPRPSLFTRYLPCRATTAWDLAVAAGEGYVGTGPAETEAVSHGKLRALALFVAALLRRGETGAWPRSWDDLADLVPERVRRDPFIGDDMRYRVTAKGLQIWTPYRSGSLDRNAPDGGCFVQAGEETP